VKSNPCGKTGRNSRLASSGRARENSWREYQGLNLTVFRRSRKGGFGWSILDSEGPEYFPGGFEDEEEALEALWFELNWG
jgi:hypothetical protein